MKRPGLKEILLSTGRAALESAGPGLISGLAEIAKDSAGRKLPRQRRAVAAGIDSGAAVLHALLDPSTRLELSQEAVLVQLLAQLPRERFDVLERAVAGAREVRGKRR